MGGWPMKAIPGRIAFDSAIVLFFIWLVVEAAEFRSLAGYFPLTVGWLGVILGIANLGIDIRRVRRTAHGHGGHDESIQRQEADEQEEPYNLPIALRYIGWVIGYIAAIWALGMVAASALFLVTFLLIESRVRWGFSILGSAAAATAMLLLVEALNLRVPVGQLFG